MPRLSKIRLTGCRYEGLQKEHENSIFDLTKNDKADHSLFTLCNGGGKGVMMQLIFQILLPKTTWGEHNGNKIISMFYDQRNNLHPFTFHVVLEWVLDTVPEKRLITGIAIKSIIKNTTDDEEEAGLSYFLYTHEHENNSPYTIENLPLYDKDTKEGVDLDKVEDFISYNRRDFRKYSKSGASRKDGDYHSYLENRGIYRSEWINLKAINKTEGGSGNYFTGAGDNQSIFDKVIIPAISENLKNYSYDDSDNLIEMFRSNLSITKDLPILIKREGDYKELLIGIEPLIINSDMGSRYNDIKERLINEGNDIYFILNDQNLFIDKEIIKWELELKKSKQEKEELLYKKDNLYYNQQKVEIQSKENQAVDLDIKLNKKTIEVEDKRKEKTLYEINKILYSRKEVEDEIESKSIDKEKLTQALDIPNIRERAEDLDNEIEVEWDKTKDRWLNVETQHSAYINYTNSVIQENNNKKMKYIEKIDSLQNDVNKFELKEEELLKKKGKLEEVYDALSLAFPERILEDFLEIQEKTKEEINSLVGEISSYNKRDLELDLEIVKLNYEIKSKKDDIELLNRNSIEQAKFELELSKNITRQLMENQVGGLLTHDWFNKNIDKLKYAKSEKDIKLDSIQRSIWERNIDKVLNKEDYFIPNKDILLIKEEINKIGINVQTGPEYLKVIDEKESLELLNLNPGFLYSLVISNEYDWEIIQKNISNDLFINNMVPIYIRSQMNASRVDQFKVVDNKAYNLVNKDQYIAWKSEMQDNIEDLIKTEANIKEDLSNIDRLIQEIKIINTRDTALMLKQKIDKNRDHISELLDKIRLIEEEKSNIKIKINRVESRLSQNKGELEENYSSLKQMEEYIGKMQEIQMENIKIEGSKKELAELKDQILILDEDSDDITYKQDQTRESYWKWKSEITSIINDVKEVYKDAIYDYKEDKNYSNYKMPGFITEANSLNSLVGERKVIEKDIATKDASIAVLNTEIKNLDKDRSRYIAELGRLSKEWTQYEYLNLPLNELEIITNELTKDIKRIDQEKVKIKSELDIIKGNIEVMKRLLSEKQSAILKIHNRAPVALDIEDINSEINIAKRAIESTEKYLTSCQEILERNGKRKIKYQINLNKIKNGYPLEISKGKTNKILKDKLGENPDLVIDEWIGSCENNRSNINKTVDDGQGLRDRLIKDVGNKLEENKLREKVISTIKDANITNFNNNLTSFKSMKDHFQKELLRLSKDKTKAEEAMKQWTDRASMHVIKMIDALKNMVSSMNYINEEGHAFPLVKLKGIERLPKEKSEIVHLLDEYFIQSVSEVLEKDIDIFKIVDSELKDLMGDKVIFSKALQGRYPTLLVYKMSEKNEFRYARARDEYYTTWEAINKGEGDLPEGSGGQTLSVNTFVIMMIMSFKKKHIGNENPSTLLILDNPFGKASAKHVLDPIFEIADKLNFQLICFAAPEIIKVEISERFPVFWELKIEDGKIVHGGRIIKQDNIKL